MACEVPVVSSNAGGIPELVIDGQTGYTSEVGEVDKMARDTYRLLSDEDHWQQMSKQALEHATTFSMDNIIPKYERYYESVLSAYKSPV